MDFLTLYKRLDFLSESIRLQYTNFLIRNLDLINDGLSIDKIVDRLRKDEPIEYILNLAEFCDLNFFVDKRVLIPRIETEEIVDRTIKFIKSNKNESFTIIDIGTGSGCIILSIASQLSYVHCHSGFWNEVERNVRIPESRQFLQKSDLNHSQLDSSLRGSDSMQIDRFKFIGIEKSTEAFEVAKINRKKLDLDEEVELINQSFEDFDFSKYENLIVLANLPYIPNSRILQKSVINFEPKEALFGGDIGDEMIENLKFKIKNLKNLKLFIIEKDQGVIENC